MKLWINIKIIKIIWLHNQKYNKKIDTDWNEYIIKATTLSKTDIDRQTGSES